MFMIVNIIINFFIKKKKKKKKTTKTKKSNIKEKTTQETILRVERNSMIEEQFEKPQCT